ncbi:MAG: hypothetical protein KAQ62_07030 [Cyclobacteriaceae bacterium]|nr:hypothetical protein [Cyclobacteriaceae bacterium]MCK5368288.1 hypothetical protein [Cyclobacteriaceae bacterium]MCK5469508.1 hypothetical protein [Cyclobacteriaceae bacterium]MCK5700494.1 hypothetical protein [Cyclobacteriaceae bacterium]
MMRKLANGMLALGLLLAVGFTSANAQDVTDEDLKNYAIIELAKTSITSGISPMVNDLIQKQEGMTGQRFQELKKGEGEPAEEWETQFIAVVNKQIDKKKKAATDVVKLLASNAMGATTYKATKAAIKSDPDMKAKFDGYVTALN